MTGLDRVKRQLISEVVRENVETLHGLPPRPLRKTRSRRVRAGLVRISGLVLAPSLLFVGVSALSTGQAERPPVVAPAVASPDDASFPAPLTVNAATFPLAVRKIVLDPGHGGTDPGAQTAVGGLLEKDLTLDVARRLRPLLTEAGFEVVMTRDGDETISLRERALLANLHRGDLFLSIHFNSLNTKSYRGLETYYLGPTSDPRVERLAGEKNRESGYSLADFRKLLEGVYTHVRQQESRQLAEAVHRELAAALVKGAPAVRDTGVRPAPFLVLVATEMPGLLAEICYVSNEDDARQVADAAHRQAIARALFEGVRGYADARRKPAMAKVKGVLR
jgi:N-acetylmuramoyl-L-alanine amidase